jgi:hypothetical protein
MAGRERRRAERAKRKARSAERRAELTARYEEKNRIAREALEPLHEDERPAVVTVGSVISGVVAASTLIAYVTGATVNGERPPLLQVLPPAVLMGVMSYGMWKARYWAVLAFQAILAIFILMATLGLVVAGSVVQVVGTLILIGAAGALFYFMVKAMARIQMPERVPRH